VQLMSANDLLFLPVFDNGRMAGLADSRRATSAS